MCSACKQNRMSLLELRAVDLEYIVIEFVFVNILFADITFSVVIICRKWKCKCT